MRAELNGKPLTVVEMDDTPSSDYWEWTDLIRNTRPIDGGSGLWMCMVSGYANKTPWVQNAAYLNGQQINANGNVYQCIVAGTSGNSSPSGTADRISDGTVVWEYVGPLAVFKQFGLISTI